jgi:hypothetical protein
MRWLWGFFEARRAVSFLLSRLSSVGVAAVMAFVFAPAEGALVKIETQFSDNVRVSRAHPERVARLENPLLAALFGQYFELPDLYTIARSETHEHAEALTRQEELIGLFHEMKIPYRTADVQPHAVLCLTGAHRLPSIRYTLTDPRAKNSETTVWEHELHEALEHGGRFPPGLQNFLLNLDRVSRH